MITLSNLMRYISATMILWDLVFCAVLIVPSCEFKHEDLQWIIVSSCELCTECDNTCMLVQKKKSAE
jgi:hypothetical protein